MSLRCMTGTLLMSVSLNLPSLPEEIILNILEYAGAALACKRIRPVHLLLDILLKRTGD